MPQIFSPRASKLITGGIFGLLVLLISVALGAAILVYSPYITGVNVPVSQVVPFPHDLHVTDLNLDCRYCHTFVDRAAFADMPPTHTCMTCHEQILPFSPALILVRDSHRSGRAVPWRRIHNLGEFTYFHHGIHLEKGVGCETCHGRVDQMSETHKTETLFMEWCLECHREPERFLRPRELVFQMGYTPPHDQLEVGRQLAAEYNIATPRQLTDCSVCHR
jgi:hypothetical protein